MPYKINGKFVSKEKFEAATAADEEEYAVSDTEGYVEPKAPKVRKPRTTSAVGAAVSRVRVTKSELARVQKLHARQEKLPSLADAQVAYDDAVAALNALLNSEA